MKTYNYKQFRQNYNKIPKQMIDLIWREFGEVKLSETPYVYWQNISLSPWLSGLKLSRFELAIQAALDNISRHGEFAIEKRQYYQVMQGELNPT